MKEREQALIFTIRGTDTATVREINRALVCVTNETDRVAPILVCVGPADLIPTWFTAIRNTLHALKGST